MKTRDVYSKLEINEDEVFDLAFVSVEEQEIYSFIDEEKMDSEIIELLIKG